MVDFVFNLGSLKGFPKFTKALNCKDWETAKKEYKRYYKTPQGKWKELKNRNKLFFDRFLKDK